MLENDRVERPPSTSFVGRRAELAYLRSFVATGRLVTVTGPGGSGKTRLAIELATRLERSFGGGVALAALAATVSRDVADVVASAVGLRGSGELTSTLVRFLRERRFLLILDNCEHVRSEVGALAEAILRACPNVALMATSRRPLAIPGEQVFPLAGLEEDPAVALFQDRARLGSPSFVLADAERPMAVTLCARLDGMPLAIELAAARMRHLGLPQLLDRMSGHLTQLGSVDSLAPTRQRTLGATVDWSHDLLDEGQRALWRRLCVFAGGFTLDAAESVAAGPLIAREDVASVLGDLVDQSMVVFDVTKSRYRVIEALREYGLARLREAAEEDVAAERHRAWMRQRLEDLDGRWWGPDQADVLDEMAAEAPNLRAALDSCRRAGDCEQGLRIVTAATWYWMTRASHAEAARSFAPFLDCRVKPDLAARAHATAAWIALLSGQIEDAWLALDQAATAARGTHARVREFVRIVDGYRLVMQGRPKDAVLVARSVLADQDADPLSRSWALVDLGTAALTVGDWEAARRAAEQGIEGCRAAGESWTQVPHLHVLATAAWQLGKPDLAASLLHDALRIDQRLDDVWHRTWTMEILAWVSAATGQAERAAQLLGSAAACRDRTGSELPPTWQRFHDEAEVEIRKRMRPTRFAKEVAAGANLHPSRSKSLALSEAGGVNSRPAPAARVSKRELEVAALVADGCSNREIAARLYVSPRTVETHVQHLLNKLDVRTRAEIAAWHAREFDRDGPAARAGAPG